MHRFEGFPPNELVTWQDLFGKVLQDHLYPQGFAVFTNHIGTPAPEAHPRDMEPESEGEPWFVRQMQQRRHEVAVARDEAMLPTGISAVFIEQDHEVPHPRLPDGLDFLRQNNVMIFRNEALRLVDVQRLAAFARDYAVYRGVSGAWASLGLLAAAPRLSENLRTTLQPTEVLPGVSTYQQENAPHLHLVETRAVMDIPENLLWHLFSFDPPKVRHALNTYRVNDPSYRPVVDAVHDRMVAERLLR